MPRKPRIILPDHPVHVIQRGNNRSASFYTVEDYQYYLGALHEAGRRYCGIKGSENLKHAAYSCKPISRTTTTKRNNDAKEAQDYFA